MLQMDTNIMTKKHYMYENLTFEIPPLWFLYTSRGIEKNRNKPL